MPTDSFSTYLQAIGKNLARGNATEHTHRPALKALLESLDAGVTATNEPQHIVDVGAPDFIVERKKIPLGYVETKDVGENLDKIEKSEQMKRYRAALPNLILTDYLEFRWYADGERRETARLGDWDGKKIKRGDEDAVVALLQKFVAQTAPTISKPRDLAERIAALAQLMRGVIEQTFARESERGNLHEWYAAFQETLIPDLTPAQFADMFAQTIAYGLFAARANDPTPENFSRAEASQVLPKTNPFLRKLFYQIAGPDLDERIAWIADDLANLLARADMQSVLKDFGKRTKREDPVVHFYETFLAAYDAKLRKSRGVFYTPEPVVSYIVRSVDHLLRTRFGKAHGLADPSVLLLDPAVGTATFLYFVIQQIYETLTVQGQTGAWANYVAEKLLPRLFGFEILMAPYTVAHLKLGVQLKDLGYDFASDQRLGIYLTNTLEQAAKQSERLLAKFISDESDAAASVKRDKPIMVVLGNPPYAGHSANASWKKDRLKKGTQPGYISGWEVGADGRAKAIYKRVTEEVERQQPTFIGQLLWDYYICDGKPIDERNPKWLQDDYVKFIRWGQWRIERTGAGILALITNHGYIDNPTFRGMRQQLMHAFSDIYVLDLHGNAKKKERAPDGSADENVFDIQQGVAIVLLVKEAGKNGTAKVHHADLCGVREDKYAMLFEADVTTTKWEEVLPASLFYLFKPQNTTLLSEYGQTWKITEILPVNNIGMQTHRDYFVTDFDKNELLERIRVFRESRLSDDEAQSRFNLRGLDVNRARQNLRADREWEKRIIPCLWRPYDIRPLYYHRDLIDRPRSQITDPMLRPNLALLAMRQIALQEECSHFLATDVPSIDRVFYSDKGAASVFPLYLYPADESQTHQKELHSTSPWQSGKDGRTPNLSPAFITDAEARLGLKFISDGAGDLKQTFGPEDIFHYIYAVFHSPTYRQRYAEFLKIDFPRLPLTRDAKLFRALVALGAELVALHLMESPALEKLITRFPIAGANAVEKVSYAEEYKDASGKTHQGCVFINKTQFFESIASDVWNFHVGGYQVLDKWLKDRKGRALSYDDITHYQKIVVALKETMRLMKAIDAAISQWPVE